MRHDDLSAAGPHRVTVLDHLHPERANLVDILLGILYIWGAYGIRFAIVRSSFERIARALLFAFLIGLGAWAIINGVAPVLR